MNYLTNIDTPTWVFPTLSPMKKGFGQNSDYHDFSITDLWGIHALQNIDPSQTQLQLRNFKNIPSDTREDSVHVDDMMGFERRPLTTNMVLKHHIEGYEHFMQFIENFKPEEPTFILYTGSKLPDGNSWCPDCVEAKPFIEKGIRSAPSKYNYVIVEVGDRSFWKDSKCPFRTNSKTQVKVLPTLVKWGTQKRLEGDQLLKNELIEMLLTEEDDE